VALSSSHPRYTHEHSAHLLTEALSSKSVVQAVMKQLLGERDKGAFQQAVWGLLGSVLDPVCATYELQEVTIEVCGVGCQCCMCPKPPPYPKLPLACLCGGWSCYIAGGQPVCECVELSPICVHVRGVVGLRRVPIFAYC
jgi:hypothetical protein